MQERSCVPNADAFPNTKCTADPSRIDKPTVHAVFGDLSLQKLGVVRWLVDHEGGSKTGTEGHFRFSAKADFRAGNFRRVARNKLIHRLFGSQSGQWRKNA